LATSALSLSHIDAFYGDSHVLADVSFNLSEARMLGLLGRNGAGKSTCMNVAVGLLPPRKGEVTVFGKSVTGLSPELVAAAGVALVPQGRRIFRSLTVRENLMVAARKPEAGSKHAPWTADTVFAMFPRLQERRNQIAAHLSGGEQQMLAMARAVMGCPKLLMLDEPSMGLAPLVVLEIYRQVQLLREQGVTILLVEQNAKIALKNSDRALVIASGEIRHHAKSADLLKDGSISGLVLGH